ncbi:nucleotidyltransferase domain-containing protein [Chryseobacterium sp. NRRL B-14798]|uniref:nucleotidyltransferase domain-containing protein n=1 Tax=Chryseobacterium sp. NRRL B-14798 TaxID=3162880 RepID=UPI003D213980
MDIYIFGSVVRGEIDKFSDIDMLIIKDNNENLKDISPEVYSIYTYDRIGDLWKEGNPFAWHLYLESKCVFTDNKVSFIKSLGRPNNYKNLKKDLYKFYKLYQDSQKSILESQHSTDFDLSMIFLAIRNFAACFSLGFVGKANFTRDSAINLDSYSLNINNNVYNNLKKARLLATRGIGKTVTTDELNEITNEFIEIEKWFNKILNLIS